MRAACGFSKLLRRRATAASASSPEPCVPVTAACAAKKQRDAGIAVVQIGTKTYELILPSVPQPIEADPGRAWPPPDGVARNLFGNSIGFGDEEFLARRGRVGGRGQLRRDARRCCCNAHVFPDDFDLPGNLLLVKTGDARARALQARIRLGRQ